MLSGLDKRQPLQDTLINSTPEDLRIINRKKLFGLGLNRTQADFYIRYPDEVTPMAPFMVISLKTIRSETKSGTALKPFTPASTIVPPGRT